MKSLAFVILILFLLLILLGYLISDLRHLEEENRRLRQTLEDQQTKSNELKAENQAFRQDAERLKQALAHERDLKEKAMSELHNLQQQVEKMRAPIEASQKHSSMKEVLPSNLPQFSDLEIVSSLGILSSTSVIIFVGLLFTLKNPQKCSNLD
jgi:cell division protein FtsB